MTKSLKELLAQIINAMLPKSGGTMTGRLTLDNNVYMYTNDNDDNPLLLAGTNASNETVFGYGAYNAGQDVYYEGGTVHLASVNPITVSPSLASFYKISLVTVTITGGIVANSMVSTTARTMTAQTGYNAVGVVGWVASNWRIKPTSFYVANNTTLYAGFSNDTSTSVTTTQTVDFRVLWLKATAG